MYVRETNIGHTFMYSRDWCLHDGQLRSVIKSDISQLELRYVDCVISIGIPTYNQRIGPFSFYIYLITLERVIETLRGSLVIPPQFRH